MQPQTKQNSKIHFEKTLLSTYRGICFATFCQIGPRCFSANLVPNPCLSQILHALAHLSRLKIIHCDLKPENILFTDSTHQHVKIIDFGASCTAFKHGFTYVQSRFYRSPEVVLGLPYDSAIDMWSFGCILAELITGQPLFPAHDENHLLEYIVLTMGSLPDQMVYNSSKYKRFFDTKGNLIKSKRSKVPDDAAPGSEPLYYLLKTDKDDELTKFIA